MMQIGSNPTKHVRVAILAAAVACFVRFAMQEARAAQSVECPLPTQGGSSAGPHSCGTSKKCELTTGVGGDGCMCFSKTMAPPELPA